MKNKYITTTITKIKSETDKVKTFTLNHSIKAKPGQYVMVWIPQVQEKPFGVVSDNPLTLSIANVGLFTKKIHDLKVGNKLTFRGPYGKSFKVKGKKIILIGGGYGVVPLYFLATKLVKLKKQCTVIIGARNKLDLVFVNQFRKLGCDIKVSTDDGSKGFKGFSTQLFDKIIARQKFDSVYACGPEVMMKKISAMCHIKKIFCQVSMERLIKCAVGVCGECSCGGKLVCKDGPVFDSKILL